MLIHYPFRIKVYTPLGIKRSVLICNESHFWDAWQEINRLTAVHKAYITDGHKSTALTLSLNNKNTRPSIITRCSCGALHLTLSIKCAIK